MNLRLGKLLIVLLITIVAAPAFAATYDATGRWHIETDPGQSLLGQNVPSVWLKAGIEQFSDDTFNMATDPIVTLDDIIYSGSGVVDGSQYIFTPTMTQEFNTAKVFPRLGVNMDLELALAGFTMISNDELAGVFSIKGFTDSRRRCSR